MVFRRWVAVALAVVNVSVIGWLAPNASPRHRAARGRSIGRRRPGLAAATGALPADAVNVVEDLVAKTISFDVRLRAPLGMTLVQSPGGVRVQALDAGGGAAVAGCRVGDAVVATSATVGDAMWPKTTIEGIESAVRSRLIAQQLATLGKDTTVSLRMRRSLDDCEASLRDIRERQSVREAWEVTLTKPLGLTLSATAAGPVVAAIRRSGSASDNNRIAVGDRVVGVSSAFGGRVWPVSTVDGVVAAAAVPTRQSITLRLEREVRVGPWSGLLEITRSPDSAMEEGEADQRVAADIGDVLRAYRELVAANLPATSTGAVLLERCCSLCRSYARAASLSQVDKVALLDAMVRTLRDVSLSAKFVTNAMSSYVYCGRAPAAAALFEACEANSTGLWPQPNVQLVTASITAYGRARRADEAFEVARRMHRWGVEIDVRMGNALLAAAAAAKDVRRAESVFAALTAPDAAGVRMADGVTYNTMVDVFARANRARDAERVFDAMRRDDSVEPTKYAYTALMKAYVAEGDLAKAKNTLESMQTASDERARRAARDAAAPYIARVVELQQQLEAEPARTASIEESIRTCRQNGTSAAAVAFREAGLASAPDTSAWNTLVNGYARTLRWREAAGALRQMEATGVARDILTFTNAATAALRADKFQEALARIVELEDAYRDSGSSDVSLRPNVFSHTIAMLACAKAADLPAAVARLAMMKRDGIPPTERTCAAMLEACLAAKRPKAGLELMAEMRAAGVVDDVVTCTLLLRCQIMAGDARSARALLRAMADDAATAPASAPNLATFNAALSGFVQLGAFDAALEVLRLVGASTYSPNKATLAPLAKIVDGKGEAKSDKRQVTAFLHSALLTLVDYQIVVPYDLYETWLVAAARTNDAERVAGLAVERRRGALRIGRPADDERLERLERAFARPTISTTYSPPPPAGPWTDAQAPSDSAQGERRP
ncbi:hypothetical protein M885DRAFT_547478 [Pelagophyceae sp. CCMP2097]|nr:hypothetical protein M885DRAFT_547478 [Pelagophyceae sp. CCMP2097]|mmetsp:Transcript_1712/g.6284  ORF Transcript_1712/g.6284 Transcript_1712/m.6284 type:complete len:955 (-) Transcript_1712:32-2896(-)